MKIKEKRYIKKCDCGTEIIYTRRDCYHNTTWDIYSLYCPSCSHEYSYRRGTHHDLFDKEYEEDSVDKDEEIERLNKELETLKQPQVFIDTQDMEERYGEELYKEYLEKENKRLNNIINEALGIANERFNYYSNHKNNNQEHLEDWGNIFNILLRRDDK